MVTARNEGLLNQIVQEFLTRLRANPLVNSSLVTSLEELALKGELKDLPAIQTALRSAAQSSDHATP